MFWYWDGSLFGFAGRFAVISVLDWRAFWDFRHWLACVQAVRKIMSVAIWVFGCCGWRAFRLFKLELTDFSVNQFFLVGGCRLEALLAGSFYGCRLMESLLLVVGDWLVLWIF